MEQKWAAGVILAHDESGTWKFLLLQNSRHGAWGFAKGHAEDCEDEMTAARREVQEETGISEYKLVEGFHETYEYDVKTENRGAYRKRVHYFLAMVSEQAFDGSEEHSDARWLSVEEASKLIQHKQTLQTLEKAAAALRA